MGICALYTGYPLVAENSKFQWYSNDTISVEEPPDKSRNSFAKNGTIPLSSKKGTVPLSYHVSWETLTEVLYLFWQYYFWRQGGGAPQLLQPNKYQIRVHSGGGGLLITWELISRKMDSNDVCCAEYVIYSTNINFVSSIRTECTYS